jgi:hypothetical protein
MLDTEKIKSIISKSLQKLASENNVPINQVQVCIRPDAETLPKYQLLVEYSYSRDINFLKEIAGIPFAALDFLGIADLNNLFMQKAFNRYMQQHNINQENISLLIFSLKANEVDAVIALYDGNKSVTQITFDDIFNQQNLLTSQ